MSRDHDRSLPKPPGIVALGAREAELLGMSAPITRRDFVGSSLLGSGAALLASVSPGTMRAAQAQTTGAAMTGLTAEWTGPGGIGDYANANGNTHEVLNAAHGNVRNHEMDKAIDSAQDTGETFDLLVVGCGLSGLAASYLYHSKRRNASILALDQHPMFGGEAKQNEFEVDGTHLWAPQGSTGMPGPFALTRQLGMFSELYADIGMPMEYLFQDAKNVSTPNLKVPNDLWYPMHFNWSQADVGYYFESKGWVKNMWADGLTNAPYSDADRVAFLRADNYRAYEKRKDWMEWLDGMTYQDFLRKEIKVDSAAFEKYIAPVAASMGCGLGPDVISAKQAYNFGMPGTIPHVSNLVPGIEVVGRQQEQLKLATLPGGNAGLARRLVQKMIPGAFRNGTLQECLLGRMNTEAFDRKNQPVRMRLSSTVIAIQHDGDPDKAKHVWVVYARGGQLYKVRGKSVVVCGQQHVNRHICRDLPKPYLEAMGTFHHAPMLTINVALRNWRFLDKLGVASVRWFEGFGWWTGLRRNVLVNGKETMPLDPNKPVVLTQYNPFLLPGLPHAQQCTAARMQLFGLSYAEIEASVRTQFTKLFGAAGFDAKRDIAGITTNRWGHAYVATQPGFFFGSNGGPAPRELMRQGYRRINFGHSELLGMQTWHNAFEEGERAARQALKLG